MALLFIKANQGTEKPDGFQKYDIVEVLNDGQSGGESAFLDDFLIVRVPDKTAEELSYLKDSEYTQADFVKLAITNGQEGQATLLKMRKYFYDFDEKIGAERIAEIRNSDAVELIDILLSDIGEKI